ncbi:MAG: hypothetical protein Q8P26_00870 [Candidatus Levybacteria bacterium]|nr:hypothetical protein [Candidatus Levybacteria bacterium]
MTDWNLFSRLKAHWGEILLYFIVGLIIILNFKPGYFILGNDNFSPEINPALTFERSMFSPGWRTYRVMGIASDSEQSDIFRTSIFLVFSKFLPAWLISQGYIFFTFFIACISMGYLTKKIAGRLFIDKFQQLSFLFGGVFYVASLLTSWIYFSPVHLFIAAYAFLPLVLWRLYSFIEKRSVGNALILLISSLFLSTSALTATMFFTCALVIIIFSILFFAINVMPASVKIKAVLLGLFIIFGTQSYWAFSFINYGKSNALALQESSINRNITSVTLQTERKNNTWYNTFRYYFSWMDARENPDIFTFPYRNWYKNSFFAQVISFLPITLSVIGTFYLLKKRKNTFLIIPILAFLGWVSIKGANPPLGAIFEWIQVNFPLLSQVFRWQSSKFWPFLAMTIPLLSSIGLIFLVDLMAIKKNIFFKSGKILLITGTILSMLIFVYPYFKGNLIREKAFVKVPKEYFSLAKYLEENDKFSRIYLAPEANTLYFRNYSWGFWGSVFLNYLIPNPIIEKALVIGSFENEQSFTVIKNSYYSESPAVFTAALRRYEAPLVLLDEHASRGNTGYFYDYNIAKKLIVENIDFEEIWGEGKLSLYRLKNGETSGLENIYFDSDFTKLNQIFSLLSNSKPYYSKKGEEGTIYPLALNFDEIQFKDDEIIGKALYRGKTANYSFLLENNFNDIPTQVNFDSLKNELSFYPLLPFLQVGNRVYAYNLPVKVYKTLSNPTFVTIGNQVVDFRKEGIKTASSFFENINFASIRYFSPTFRLTNLADVDSSLFNCDNLLSISNMPIEKGEAVKCQAKEIKISKDSVLEFLMQFESSSMVRALLCVESEYKKQCVNKNTAAFVKGSADSTMLVPLSFQAGDSVKIYLNFDNAGEKDAVIYVKNFNIKFFEDSKAALSSPVPSKNFSTTKNILLAENENIYVHIPVYSGENSWTLNLNDSFVPESSASNSQESISIKGANLITKAKEGSVNIYPNIGSIDGRLGIGMAAIDSDNKKGIPLFFNLKDNSSQSSLWGRQAFLKRKTNLIDLFLLPQKIADYRIEGKSEGIGPVVTENSLNNFVLQMIPRTWYGMKLSPDVNTSTLFTLNPSSNTENNTYIGEAQEAGIYSIPTAYSKDWQLTVDGKIQQNDLLINGWQQGWEVDRVGEVKVVFSQNKIIYLGFLPLILIVGFVMVKVSRNLLTRGG